MKDCSWAQEAYATRKPEAPLCSRKHLKAAHILLHRNQGKAVRTQWLPSSHLFPPCRRSPTKDHLDGKPVVLLRSQCSPSATTCGKRGLCLRHEQHLPKKRQNWGVLPKCLTTGVLEFQMEMPSGLKSESTGQHTEQETSYRRWQSRGSTHRCTRPHTKVL